MVLRVFSLFSGVIATQLWVANMMRRSVGCGGYNECRIGYNDGKICPSCRRKVH